MLMPRLPEMRFDLVGEENELQQNLAPVVDSARPFEHNVLGDEIDHFEQCLVGRENGFSFCDLAQLPMIALNYVGRVDGFSDFERIFEERRELAPVLAPTLHFQRVSCPSQVLNFVPGGKPGVFRRCRVNRLEIMEQLFRILVRYITDGIANLMHNVLLDFRLGETGGNGF